MMKKGSIFLLVLVLALSTITAVAAQGEHMKAALVPVGESGISGFVQLEALPEGGTNIHVVATGLTPGEEYVSLYYENTTCELEPYGEDDVIGGTYTANAAGTGVTHSMIDDDLDEVLSVSVRRASDFELLSCALTQ